MRKRSLFFIIFTIIGVVLFAILVYKIGWHQIRQVFSMFDWWEVATLVGTFFLFLIFISKSTMVILKALGYKLSFKKMYPLVCIAFSIGYVTPVPYTGGEPVQIYLMYKRNRVPISAGTTALLLEKVSRQTMALIVILAGVGIAIATVPMPWFTRIILIAIVAFFLFILWAYYAKSLSGEGFMKYMIRIFRCQNIKLVTKPKHARIIKNIDRCTTNFLKGNPRAFWTSMGFAILSTAVMVSQISLVLYYMEYQPTLTGVILIYMFTNLIVLIPTPAMLGTYEAGGMAVFAIEGIGAGFGLIFSLIIRIASIFTILPGLLMLPYYGLTIKDALVDGKELKEKLVPLNHENGRSRQQFSNMDKKK